MGLSQLIARSDATGGFAGTKVEASEVTVGHA